MYSRLKKIILGFSLGVISTPLLSGTIDPTIVDHGIYTTLGSQGLDWLDLSETVGKSYYDISGQLNSTYNGWRYATYIELIGYYSAHLKNYEKFSIVSAWKNALIYQY